MPVAPVTITFACVPIQAHVASWRTSARSSSRFGAKSISSMHAVDSQLRLPERTGHTLVVASEVLRVDEHPETPVKIDLVHLGVFALRGPCRSHRHTCASSLVAGWWGRRWSLEEVREMLGHSSVLVTERYAHFADSAIDRAARATHRVEGSAKDHATGSGGPTPSSVAAITNYSEELLRVGRAGLEPATYGLKVRSSTD